MKRILSLVVLLLVSFVGFAQAPTNYTNINGRYRWIAGMFDSTFSLPKGATPSLRTGGSSNPGALFYRTTDSTVKYWTGTQWLTLSDSTRYVPYTGATKNVNLGQYGMTTKWLQFDTSSQAVTDRRLQWSNDDGTLQFGMTNGSTITNRIGLEQFARVKNVDATQINKGEVVYLFGASGDRAAVKKADNRQDSTSSKTLGVATEDIPVDSVGFVGTFGVVGKLNLAAYTPGDILYLDSIPGQMTKTKPQAPYHLVFIGVVERANAGNGLLFVNPQNGYELEELHNVRITSPVNNNAILAYDSVARLWKDTTLNAIGGITGNLVSGYLTKATGANTIDTSQIFQSAGLIGIGTITPARKLDVNGDAFINGLTVGKGRNSVSSNTAFGVNSLLNNTSGYGNVSIGSNNLYTNTTGFNNTSVGLSSLYFNTTGTENTTIGNNAMTFNTTGSGNVAIGLNALYRNTAGGTNIAIGNQAGELTTTNANNQTSGSSIYLGVSTRPTASGNENEIIIGNYADGNGSNSVTLGNTSITKTILRSNVGVGTASPDSALQVVNGALFQRGVRMSGLPTGAGTRSVRINANGTLSVADTLANGVSGTGTTNYIPKFTSSSAIGNSLIFDNGTNVGISTTSPSYKLDVSGTLRSTSSSYFATGGGNIGIGTSTVTGIGGPILQIHASAFPEIHLTNSTTGDQFLDGTSIYVNGTNLNILNYESGSINFSTNNTERMRLDASGNLGLGVSPNASWAVGKVLQINNGSFAATTAAAYFSSNWYFDGANKYLANGFSTTYQQFSGQHVWYNAPNNTSGAGAAMTLTQAMILDASGNLAIGTTSAGGKLHINNSSGDAIFRIQKGSSAIGNIDLVNEGSRFSIQDDGTRRLVIDLSGNVGIGTTSPSTILNIASASPVIRLNPTTQNNPTAIEFGVLNAGTNAYAKIDAVNETTYDTNLRFFTNASGSTTQVERMRITSGGELLINTTSDAGDYKLQVNGNVYSTNSSDNHSLLNTSAAGGDVLLGFQNTGDNVNAWGVGRRNTGEFWIANYTTNFLGGTRTVAMEINTSLNTTFAGSIKTAAPSGGTAKPFKIGAAAVVSPTSPNRTIEIEIDGVTYYLTAKTTND